MALSVVGHRGPGAWDRHLYEVGATRVVVVGKYFGHAGPY